MATFRVFALCLVCAIANAAVADTQSDNLKVLVWNAWRGGNEVEQGPEKVLAVIREVAPDIVLMQESYDIDDDRPTLGRWIASELGWNSYQGTSPHLCVLTPYEIKAEFFHDAWHGVGVRVTDKSERTFIAWSIWLDYRAYLTWELRDKPDRTDEDLLAAENVRSSRLPEAKALLEHLKKEDQLRLDVPLLVGGDWNTPSHLDWTTDTARVYRHRRPLKLPVSTLMHDAGFVDTYRSIHPNPVQHPGITWSPMFRVAQNGGDQGFERIDRLYLKNPSKGEWTLQPISTQVLPKEWESEDIPPAQRVFPSDHCAVSVDLKWVRTPTK